MRITLSSPIPYKDSTLDFIDLELETLTGRDLIAIEDTARAAGQTIALYSQSYFAAVAAKASHLPADIIRSLNIKDFMTVNNQVMSFLLGLESTDSVATTSEA